jgi:uncharacterized alkaline shock family protein YloU
VERQLYETAATDLGRISVSSGAIAQLVRRAATESYGVVGLAERSALLRFVPWGSSSAIRIRNGDEGLAIELRVVVEHGLRLAEVGAAARARVLYELERQIGLPVSSVEVHIDRVRRSR